MPGGRDGALVARRELSSATMVTLLLLASSVVPALAGTFAEVGKFGSNPGNLKMFTYLPDRLSDPAPLVVVLHGCGQSARSYLEHSGWREEADDGGFALLLPEQQIGPGPIFFPSGRNHPARCFNFAELRDSRRDSGEALSVNQMVEHMAESVGIDPAQIFVNGLSAGGGMTAVMLAAYPDVFAAGAVIAGVPYRCGTSTRTGDVDCGVTLTGHTHNPAPDETPEEWGDRVRAAVRDFDGRWPRVSIWQGAADPVVDPRNAIELMEQWTDVHGIDQPPEVDADLDHVTRRAFTDAAGETLVESYLISGLGHATPINPDSVERACGRTGDAFIVDADICSTREIARFFGLVDAAPRVAIHRAESNETTITLKGTATDPNGTVTDVTVRLDGPVPRPAASATGTEAWSIRFDDLTADTFYVPIATAVDDDGLTATVKGERVAVGSPVPNQPPTVAIDDVLVERNCVVVEGRATDPDGRVVDVAVRLGTRPPQAASLQVDRFAFQACGLADGTYTIEVVATDFLAGRTTVDGPSVEVETMEAESGTWLDHTNAGRLRVYLAPCPSVGFGACDAAFPTIFAEHDMEPFPLFRRKASESWFVNPGNIP